MTKLYMWHKPLNVKIRSTLRVRIEGHIENSNGYCIQIDYDDNNDEVEEEEEEEEEGGRKKRYKVIGGSYSTWL